MQTPNDIKMHCPCHSKLGYGQCCRPFHQGQLPKTAVQLMRSRYCAYALCLPDYIIQTTHPANPEFSHDIAQWSQEISTFCLGTQFKDLKILSAQEIKTLATVTFLATLFQDQKDISFTEKSSFEKINGKWLYVNGQMQQMPAL